MELKDKSILLGVTGGIAAYKAAELVRLLVKAGARVQVVMTTNATRFVAPLTFQALSGQRVYVDAWENSAEEEVLGHQMAHIDLSRQADLILVAPASANFLAKLAQGLADDLLSTVVLARPQRQVLASGNDGFGMRECPLLVAPAMNQQMWQNPATQRNIALLKNDGVTVLGPGEGAQACGEIGAGRMLEPTEIIEELVAFLQPKLLVGKKVLVTAGPTFEAIDPVRGICNLSSGRMGFAVARAAHEAGAEVTLIAGPVSQPTPRGVTRVDITSAMQMYDAVMEAVGAQDVFIAVAAVADYRPQQVASQKIKKDAQALSAINLVKNPDILAEVAALKHAPLCVGFAAESENLTDYAERKRRAKKLPLLVGNLVQDGLGGEENTIVLFNDKGHTLLPSGPKIELARTLITHIAHRLRQ